VTAPISEKPNSGRGNQGGRGNHGGRGAGRGDKKGKPVKHEGYDRQSGTGRGKEVSKGGSGRGNWGNPKEEAEQAEKEHLEDVAASATDEETAVAAGVVVDEVVVEVVEPEIPTYTLDHYLAQRDSARANNEIFGAFSVRAVEGDFSGMKTKEESGDTFIALGAAKAPKKKEQNQRSGS
jgi:hypothetical protein